MNSVDSIVCWIASIICVFVHDRAGRRKMFMVSILSCVLDLSCPALYTVRFQTAGSADLSRGTMVFIYLFGVTSSFPFPHQYKYIICVKLLLTGLYLKVIFFLIITVRISQFVNQFASPRIIMANVKCWF